jgi:hypothetical protein
MYKVFCCSWCMRPIYKNDTPIIKGSQIFCSKECELARNKFELMVRTIQLQREEK